MNPTIKEKWVAALKSGRYKQGIGSLKTGDQFCCLGVLCDLYAKETGAGQWKLENDLDFGLASEVFATKSEFQEYALPQEVVVGWKYALPQEVVEWAGLESADPVITIYRIDDEDALSTLNDSGINFDGIAKLIEDNL